MLHSSGCSSGGLSTVGKCVQVRLASNQRPLVRGSVRLQVTRRQLVTHALDSATAVGLATSIVLGTAMAANAGILGSNDPNSLIRSGMDKFRKNDVEGSIKDFDKAMEAAPRMRPYLWQRGLSLYYAEQFEEGAQQFRDDVAVNPNDTEESIWAYLCEAQMVGPEKAREDFLEVGVDSRPYMRAAYECFKTGGDPGTILAAANDAGSLFYAWLYVGLYHEAHGSPNSAEIAMTKAAATPYAQRSGDYMASLARVHCKRRGWEWKGVKV